jgi:hypothetical protein
MGGCNDTTPSIVLFLLEKSGHSLEEASTLWVTLLRLFFRGGS